MVSNMCQTFVSIFFSSNKALKKGFRFSNDGFVVSLNYKHVNMAVDRVISAADGCVTEVLMKTLTAKKNQRIYQFINQQLKNLWF
jgi:hypothetical protein